MATVKPDPGTPNPVVYERAKHDRELAMDAAFDAAALAEVKDQAELQISREQLRQALAQNTRLLDIIELMATAISRKKARQYGAV